MHIFRSQPDSHLEKFKHSYLVVLLIFDKETQPTPKSGDCWEENHILENRGSRIVLFIYCINSLKRITFRYLPISTNIDLTIKPVLGQLWVCILADASLFWHDPNLDILLLALSHLDWLLKGVKPVIWAECKRWGEKYGRIVQFLFLLTGLYFLTTPWANGILATQFSLESVGI